MGSAQQTADVSLFNNSLLSDITIRQTSHGITKEYPAHKAMLCSSSGWFTRALTGNFQEATSRIIDLRDDDPIYFEALLRYLYDHQWHQPTLDKKEHKKENGNERVSESLKGVLDAVGVYSLADKYDVEGLRALALAQISQSSYPYINYRGEAMLDNVTVVVRAHYGQCRKINCPMGQAICRSLVKDARQVIKEVKFEILGEEYSNLNLDMYHAARANDGRLW